MGVFERRVARNSPGAAKMKPNPNLPCWLAFLKVELVLTVSKPAGDIKDD
jgi:hypothetical protein